MKGINVALKNNFIKGTHDPKIIDFGVGVTNYKQLLGYSAPYFFNGYTRTKSNLSFISFKTAEDRVKVEFYGLGIMILQILLLSLEIK